MKLKTHKALSKRLKITKKGKILKRTAGQDHFNSRESGKTTRNKKSDKQMTSTMRKASRMLSTWVSGPKGWATGVLPRFFRGANRGS